MQAAQVSLRNGFLFPSRFASFADKKAFRKSNLKQHPTHSAQLGAPCQRVGAQFGDLRPETRRVVEVNQVRKFVRGNVIDQRERRLYQPPVEADMAAPGAAAPLRLRVGQGETAGG